MLCSNLLDADSFVEVISYLLNEFWAAWVLQGYYPTKNIKIPVLFTAYAEKNVGLQVNMESLLFIRLQDPKTIWLLKRWHTLNVFKDNLLDAVNNT